MFETNGASTSYGNSNTLKINISQVIPLSINTNIHIKSQELVIK